MRLFIPNMSHSHQPGDNEHCTHTLQLYIMLIAYIIEQIWLPLYKYRPNCSHYIWPYRLSSIYFTSYCDTCAKNMPTTMHIYTLFLVAYIGMYVHICATYEVTSISHGTGRTLHILHKLHYMILSCIIE